MKYPLMSKQEILPYITDMISLGVSEVARSPKGFLSHYMFNPEGLNEEWNKKRDAFISRTLPAFLKNPSYRRALSLICWAYMPTTKEELNKLRSTIL